jgi:hypothetical protein
MLMWLCEVSRLSQLEKYLTLSTSLSTLHTHTPFNATVNNANPHCVMYHSPRCTFVPFAWHCLLMIIGFYCLMGLLIGTWRVHEVSDADLVFSEPNSTTGVQTAFVHDLLIPLHSNLRHFRRTQVSRTALFEDLPSSFKLQ